MSEVDVDVVVVGAGFSGLVAARALRRAGLTLRVLEAADRVGGRAMTVSSAAGTPVDLGGQWIGRHHVRMRALAREFGMTLFPTPTVGKPLMRDANGDVRPFSATSLGAGWALTRLAVMLRTGPGVHDDRTVADWVARIRPQGARRLVEIALSEAVSTDLDLISMRATAQMLRTSGGLGEVFGSAQESLLSGGAGGLATAIAAELGPAVALNQPVTEILRDDQTVTVRTSGDSIRTRRVVIAVAPPVARAITHHPALPESRTLVQRDTFMGTIYKAVIVYDEPFWRNAGLSGQLTDLDGPVPTLADISPPGGPGHLCTLIPGRQARVLDVLAAETRRETVLCALAKHFGDRARAPLSFHEKSWHQDEFVHGGYTALPRPGSLDAIIAAGNDPVGRVHWASTEAAPHYTGYFEGAVRSGERAAAEVLAAL